MIKGAKTIAEYAIRKWLEQEGFVPECFCLKMTTAHMGTISDGNGDTLELLYDPESRMVIVHRE